MTNFFAHETAVVEPGATIGDGTKVWHHAHVREGALIGSHSVLGKNVFVDSGAVIGDRCKVQNNVSVYSGVHLEDDVFVGPSAVFTNDRNPRSTLDGWVLTETHIRHGASIGGNATVVAGVEVGPFSMVGAGAVVTRDVVAFELVVGVPARHAGWVCRCGSVVARGEEPRPETTCAECGQPPFIQP